MKSALIVVDVQSDFCPGGALAVPEGDRVIPAINALAPRFDCVVATRDWHPPGHISFASRHGLPPLQTVATAFGPQILWPDHCVQGTPGAAFAPGLDTARFTHVTLKGTDPEVDSYSGFFDNARRHRTDLDAVLRRQGVTAVFIVGLATDYCVKFTALDALELGYATTVVTDACRGVEAAPGDVTAALEAIRRAGGATLPCRHLELP